MTAPLTTALASAERHRDGQRLTVALQGEIDLSTIAVVKSALTAGLDDTGEGTLVVDLRQVTFMDSTGLHALCALRDQATRQATRLVLIRGPRQVHRVFELTATDRLFEFVDDSTSIAAVLPTTAPAPPTPARQTRGAPPAR